jgi:hypothetical protein
MIESIVHVGGAAGEVVEEVLEHVLAVGGVHHLGVELHAVDLALGVFHAPRPGHRRCWPWRKARWNLGHGVEVAHPHVLRGRQVRQQRGLAVGDGERGPAVLAAHPRPTVPPSCWAMSCAP